MPTRARCEELLVSVQKHFLTRNRPLVTLRRSFNPKVSRWASRGALGVGLFLVACSSDQGTPGVLDPNGVPSGASTSEGNPSAPTAVPSAGASDGLNGT